MNAETKSILAEMGIYQDSQLTVPEDIASLGLKLSVTRNGNSVIVYCNGGQGEYDFLGNHGAYSTRHEVLFAADEVPYLTLSPVKLGRVLRSIAINRILIRASQTGDRPLCRSHQKLANQFVGAWLAALPSETQSVYGSRLASEGYSKAYGRDAYLSDVASWNS